MKKSTDKLPRIVRMVDGKAVPVSPDEVRNLRIVAGQSQPDLLPEPPSELEKLRDKADFYKRHLRRVNHELNNVLNIAAIQESGYVDAILRLAQAQTGDTQQPTKVSAPKREKPMQVGRYRLTDQEIKFRRLKVKEANKIKKSNPQKQWKEVDKQFAEELNISDRTFRSWRHNNY